MSSFYEKDSSELGLSGELTQMSSEELEFEYLFNYEPQDSDFPSGDPKGLIWLSVLLLRGVCVCERVE